MKKVLLSMLALCMSVSMFGRTIYLNTTTVDYGADNAFLAIWTWGGTSSDAWSVFSAVQGEEKLFSAEIADDKTGGKIVRFNSSVTEPSWVEEYQWNKTGDLTIPSDANMITLTQWDNEQSGSWSTCTPAGSTDPAVALTVTGTTELGSEVTLSAAVSNIEGEVTYKYYVKVDDGEFTALEADKYTFEALGTYTFKVEAKVGDEVQATDTKEVTITNVVTEYYLVGYINGADYGCNDDYINLGEYKFVDGKLTATFTTDSYVFVKTGDNNNWYMSETYVEPAANVVATLKQGETTTEKVGVKANVEVHFTLTENGDGTLTLAYTTAGTTALQAITMADIYANNGRIYGADDMRIYTVLGLDVTNMNGQLNGIYVVKTQAGIVKVVVR